MQTATKVAADMGDEANFCFWCFRENAKLNADPSADTVIESLFAPARCPWDLPAGVGWERCVWFGEAATGRWSQTKAWCQVCNVHKLVSISEPGFSQLYERGIAW